MITCILLMVIGWQPETHYIWLGRYNALCEKLYSRKIIKKYTNCATSDGFIADSDFFQAVAAKVDWEVLVENFAPGISYLYVY